MKDIALNDTELNILDRSCKPTQIYRLARETVGFPVSNQSYSVPKDWSRPEPLSRSSHRNHKWLNDL